MKYYLSEYWMMMNSDNPETREEGKEKWIESVSKYGPYFKTVRDKLPKRFMKEFDKNSQFHDFSIDNINISSNENNTITIDLNISYEESVYKLKLFDIKGLLINMPSTKNLFASKLTWGYTEFELNNNTWTMRVLCDLQCELGFIFKKIGIEKL